jgi:putative two-component system response regulator
VGPDLKDAAILIVDDQGSNVLLLQRLLEEEGYSRILTTSDSSKTARLVKEQDPDLILLDLVMPHPDGFEVMEELRQQAPEDEYLPILVLTADITPQARQRALAKGARDFLTKPFNPIEVLLRIHNLLETRYLYMQVQQQNRTLEKKVAERTQ